jgi:hypothetical protein
LAMLMLNTHYNERIMDKSLSTYSMII